MQDRRYKHYENRRLREIEEARQRRKELLSTINNDSSENNSKKFNSTGYRNNTNANTFLQNKNVKLSLPNNFNKTFQYNLHKNKSENHSSLIKKELEKLELIKKQNLGEIRNLIDYEFNINETKKKNEEKEKIKNIKEKRIRLEKIKIRKIKELEMKEKEEERLSKKRKEEREFQKKIYELEQKKIHKQQIEEQKKKKKS